jgi:hypothetical protein
MNGESAVLFGSADTVTGICSEEKTQTLAQVDFRHDNAPAHDVLRVREFLAKKFITKMDHPPYSTDLAPCDFLALSQIKKCPEGTKVC